MYRMELALIMFLCENIFHARFIRLFDFFVYHRTRRGPLLNHHHVPSHDLGKRFQLLDRLPIRDYQVVRSPG
jgi:hypothetical protein